ncbi:MAG: hypothetical protein KKA73_01520 [Chloroflexi bacterium]|nr:hypothetical protein [Chloroflexota bacterium]MBU1746343.1 hypothetical protein [Chloroflexota bacterium]
MDKQELLRRATEHIFSTGLDDSGARLGLANMRYGLAKIHLAQEALGLPPNATFITAPDLTVTRNHNRWQSGFGYGGRLTWGDGQQELVILDLKPNCCGMLVGGLGQLPERDALLRQVRALCSEELCIDGIPFKWDFGSDNHFISLYRVVPQDGACWLPYAFVMHGSGSELRGESEWGDGLYWDKSEALRRRVEVLETPFGPLHYLSGQAAQEYHVFYQRVDAFARNRRSLVAGRLFDEFVLYNNDAHQGLSSMNDMLLGAYVFHDTQSLFPITLQAHLPAYLVRGRPNLSDVAIERLGFAERAHRQGVYGRLQTANLIPHGGGYTFPHVQDVVSVIELDGERYFELSFYAGAGRQLLSHVRDLPYTYRGLEVVERVVELGLADLVAQLDPIYGLKL